MAESGDSERRLPIRVVIPQDQDFTSSGGGGPRTVFGEVDQEVRNALLEQVGNVRRYFGNTIRPQGIPAVARVVLKQEALAKSHRPRRLFSRDTCPIIGGETFGNLLISVNDTGLGRLEQTIGRNQTQDVTADLSTVTRIEPFTASDAVAGWGLDGLAQHLAEDEPEKIKIKLFRHRNSRSDAAIIQAFQELIEHLGLEPPEQLRYAEGARIYITPVP